MNTYGKNLATIILVGSKLEYPCSYTEEARQLLKGGQIHSVLIGYLEKEARQIVKWVRASNLINKANTIASKLLQQGKY